MDQLNIAARGMTFTALTDGPDDGPLLLALHGLPRTSWEWHHQLPKLAEAGYRAVAPDMRGYCPGARPDGVEAYVADEFVADILAIADELGGIGKPFHLMGTSIGAIVAWCLAAENPERVATLACINIPHPNAFTEIATTAGAEEQRQKMSYMQNSRKEGNESATFQRTLKNMGLPEVETNPYRDALSGEQARQSVYNWYRALPLWSNRSFPPVTMPTLFMWPPNAGNVARGTAEANAQFVEGPYQFEVLEHAKNFALQLEPERTTDLLLSHLAAHDKDA